MGPVITAHPLQLTFAAACADVFLDDPTAAVADSIPRRGVAYLVRADLAITAASVVAGRPRGGAVWVRFSGGLRSATIGLVDEEADCALLELRPAVVSQLCLNLRHGLCQHGDACQTWAAVPTLRSPGQVVQALVREPLGEDALRGPALLLHMVAGNERWHPSLAGSPILHDGYVVGHLRAFTSEGGQTLLYACPAPYVESMSRRPGTGSLPQPPKAGFSRRWYVERPTDESWTVEALGQIGRPALIFAPERHGKTWLVERVLGTLRESGGTTVYVNVERLLAASSPTLEGFLVALAGRIERELPGGPELGSMPRPGAAVAPAQSPPRPPAAAVEAALERGLVQALPRFLYLALDQLDSLRDTLFHDEVIRLLSDWAERSGREPLWARLRLLLISASAPDWLVQPQPGRPFVTLNRTLPDLSPAQVESLAALHGLPVSPSELAQLGELVGGHPYLCRVALYTAVARGLRLGDVLQQRAAMPTVFDPFLEACRRRVAAQSGLFPTLGRVLRGQSLEALDRLLLPRLERMGLVRRVTLASAQPEYAVRYPLYRRLLDL